MWQPTHFPVTRAACWSPYCILFTSRAPLKPLHNILSFCPKRGHIITSVHHTAIQEDTFTVVCGRNTSGDQREHFSQRISSICTYVNSIKNGSINSPTFKNCCFIVFCFVSLTVNKNEKSPAFTLAYTTWFWETALVISQRSWIPHPHPAPLQQCLVSGST